MVSEWRSVIAVSLKVGGGVFLIKPANLCMCTQKLQTQRGRTHGARCVRQWFHTAEPLGERRYENWNTHTQNIPAANIDGRRIAPFVRFMTKYNSIWSKALIMPLTIWICVLSYRQKYNFSENWHILPRNYFHNRLPW